MKQLDNIKITGMIKNNGSCILQTDSALRITITVVRDNLLRIWMNMTEENILYSHTVLEQDSSNISFDVQETEETYRIKTKLTCMEVEKAGIIYRFLDKEGTQSILQTYPGDAFRNYEDDAFQLKFLLEAEEHIYGLGEDNDAAFGRLDRRGAVRDLITGQRISKNHVTADYPIPFLLSAGGKKPYGLYIDNTFHMRIDVGKEKEDCCCISADGGPCCFYYIAGDSIPEIHETYINLIGRPVLPPLWVLGYMQSKCSFRSWEEIDNALYCFQKDTMPIDSIVFDFDWAEFLNNYKWSEKWKGLSAQKMHYYRTEKGIHFLASNSGPMLKKNADTFSSALESGILARDKNGSTVTCGHYSGELMDFTNPSIEPWLEPQIRRVMEDGIEGWWLDLTEPEGDGEDTVFFAGNTAEYHNIFCKYTSEVYHKIMKRTFPGKRSFVLTRAGTAGIQRFPTALWTGDVYSEYGTLSAHIPEALNTGLSGIPMWTSDTGGFISASQNASCPYNLYHNNQADHGLLFERWMQFSCFTPIMRAHHAGGEAVPFRYQEIMADGMRHYIKLRYRLLPYIYSLYYESYLKGTPIMRPLFWHYPQDRKACTIQDEYLFGPWMLVAPVLEEKQSERDVYLPEGTWYDWDYGYEYEGGNTIRVFAPQNRIPVFIREGALLPMADDILNTRELDWKRVEISVFPSEYSTYTMYADDGNSERYLEGDYTATQFICEGNSFSNMRLHMHRNNNLYLTNEIIAHIHIKAKPEDIFVNGQKPERAEQYLGLLEEKETVYYYDEFKQILHVKFFWKDEKEPEVMVYFRKDHIFPPNLPYAENQERGQLPYIYPAASIPCIIPAANYDRGGEGIAFHKNITSESKLYREDNAGIRVCNEIREPFCIQDLSAGEWLKYSVLCNNGKQCRITIGCRGQAVITVAVNSQIMSGRIKVDSADWGRTVIKQIYIAEGEQVIELRVQEGKMDLYQLTIEE